MTMRKERVLTGPHVAGLRLKAGGNGGGFAGRNRHPRRHGVGRRRRRPTSFYLGARTYVHGQRNARATTATLFLTVRGPAIILSVCVCSIIHFPALRQRRQERGKTCAGVHTGTSPPPLVRVTAKWNSLASGSPPPWCF